MRIPLSRVLPPLGALALAVGLATPFALADDAPAARAPAEACRVATIPAHERVEQRTIQVPPVTCTERVPRYETVEVPVYEQRCVPVYDEVQVPVYATREVPVYRTERVPIWGEREVTVYQEVCEPVTISLWNPFACEDEEIELWNRTRCVPCGTEMQPAIVDYEERQVPCGMRTERYVAGTETRRVQTGTRTETVQVGVREEQRLVGYDTRVVVVEPARTETIEERVCIPTQHVTVVPDEHAAAQTEPLPGTTHVMTETEFVQASTAARTR